jgi:hypothetical protein
MQLETVAAFLAGHHAGDTGPGGSAKGPCAIAGMFGCSPAAASEEYGEVIRFGLSSCSKTTVVSLILSTLNEGFLISFLEQPWYPTDDAGIAPWPTTLAS